MPILEDVETGAQTTVPDEAAYSMVKSGQYKLAKGETVTANARFGQTVAAGNLKAGQGLEQHTSAEDVQAERTKRIEGKTSWGGSLLRGTIDAALLGLPGAFEDPEEKEADAKYHPYAHLGGEIVGALPTLLIPGAGEANIAKAGMEGLEIANEARVGTTAFRAAQEGSELGNIVRRAEEAGTFVREARGAEELGSVANAERAAAGLGSRARSTISAASEFTPMGQIAKASRAASGLIKGEGALANIGRAGVAGATFGGLEGAGREAIHQITDDQAGLDGEGIITAGIHGALLGGALGAGGAALSEGIGAAGSAFGKMKGAASEAGGLKKGFGLGSDVIEPEANGIMDRAKQFVTEKASGLPVVGKIAKAINSQSGRTLLMFEAVQEGGLHAVTSLLHTVAPVAAAGALGAGAVRALFSNPVIGGMLVAHGSQVLDGFSTSPSDPRPSNPPRRDIRLAAADLAKRVRAVTPESASNAAGMALGPHADPATLMKAQEAARTRQNALVAAVDLNVPTPRSVVGNILPQALPTAEASKRLLDTARVAQEPLSFIKMAAMGNLTPSAMGLAQTIWPAHVDAVRQRLLTWLATGPTMTTAERRNVEALLGSSLLDPRDSKQASWASAMAASHQRAQQSQKSAKPPASGQRGPDGASATMPMDPATKASDPTAKH
jgi:hypothetical protein